MRKLHRGNLFDFKRLVELHQLCRGEVLDVDRGGPGIQLCKLHRGSILVFERLVELYELHSWILCANRELELHGLPRWLIFCLISHDVLSRVHSWAF